MTRWIRFEHQGKAAFGTLTDGRIEICAGDMFDAPRSTGERVPLDAVEILIPCQPTKMICLWNNLKAVAEKKGLAAPAAPLYVFKSPSSFLPSGGAIVQPASYDAGVVYEGELGIVIGKRCKNVAAADVDDCIFGYTCVNDVTALQLIDADASFAQWCRAKSFDTFGVFGPVIATGVDPQALEVTTSVDGSLRQSYPVSDMFFSPRQLVERISRDATLEPGDIIACGTSLGSSPMEPGSTVEVRIEGIGTLSNTFGDA